ncbi:hypothetical protein ABG067_004813 [Albugo candida]|uniref:Uncharacterized protein n=1 Tax=Albugo candida TaxID=65357 RepID=A0A024FVA2_9STRA|nr:unnamed protein product [Albugo candida]|eukprot:CCI10966.1 unnamed protein product [Albugo candida]
MIKTKINSVAVHSSASKEAGSVLEHVAEERKRVILAKDVTVKAAIDTKAKLENHVYSSFIELLNAKKEELNNHWASYTHYCRKVAIRPPNSRYLIIKTSLQRSTVNAQSSSASITPTRTSTLTYDASSFAYDPSRNPSRSVHLADVFLGCPNATTR